jgi:thiamine-phosphate pyrophosphorylase
MKLIVITPPTFFIEEDKIITTLFEEGLDYLHLRKPDTEPMYSERLLTLISERYHKRIVTHDHFYLKTEFDLLGIHLSERNPKAPENYRGPLSRSCSSLEELKKCKSSCNYVLLSPPFDGIAERNYRTYFSKEELKKAARAGLIDKKVMALGGIDEASIPEAKEYGFGGVAILGDLWNRFDMRSNPDYKGIIEHFRVLKKLTD